MKPNTVNSAPSRPAVNPLSAQAQAEKGEAEAILNALDRYRRLNGERYANHLLRNLLQQSAAGLRDLGIVSPDDQRAADLEMQLEKALAEMKAATAYANHFAMVLRSITTTAKDEHTAAKAKRALEWKPGEKTDEDIAAVQGAVLN